MVFNSVSHRNEAANITMACVVVHGVWVGGLIGGACFTPFSTFLFFTHTHTPVHHPYSHMSTTASVVGLLFLPLSFLTGVFGEWNKGGGEGARMPVASTPFALRRVTNRRTTTTHTNQNRHELCRRRDARARVVVRHGAVGLVGGGGGPRGGGA
jgi:hypothetical protein